MKIAPPNTYGAVDLNRRKFLQITTLGLAVVTSGGLLASCSSDDGAATSPDGASGKPVKGGTLRVGSTGGGTTDTLDPQAWATLPDQLRVQQLYDPLVWMGADGKPVMVLATEITPNADGTEWTIKIQEGVTTHSGAPFTAEDVLFSFQRVLDNKFPGAFLLGPIDMKNSKAVDDTTVSVKFSKPYGILLDTLSFPYFYMVPRGFDLKKPDGTGPFKFKSFTPGEESTFVRNENYWQSGLPYLDAVVIQNITDESSQMSAFQAGQVDIINALSAGSVAALKGGGTNVKVSESGNWVPFTMNCQADPFSDPKVRQAFRLIPDRQQMLEQVFGGYGSLGNDVFSPYDAGFPSDLEQRAQDLDQAKSLLASAGQSDLTIKLTTTPAAAGEVSLAQVFATQAKGAGINVQVDEHPVGAFYSDYYLKVPFGNDYGTTQLFLNNASQLMIGDKSFYNANHFDDPEYTALYDQAAATTDATARNEMVGQLARIDYERGGYIVPVFSPAIEAYSAKVGGITDYVTGVSPNNADFKNMWLASLSKDRPTMTDTDARAVTNGQLRLAPLDQRTTPEAVHRVLREAILNGTFSPGSQLREAHIAADLGISRAPLREAFSRLEEEGLLERVAFRGAFVSQVSPQTIEEIAVLRFLVEPYAAEQTAAHLGAELAGRVQERVQSLREAANRGDMAASIDAHLEFHRFFYEYSGNDLLLEQWNGWETRLRLFLAVDHRSYDDLEELAAAHEHLASLVEEGHMERFRTELAHHVHKAPGAALED